MSSPNSSKKDSSKKGSDKSDSKREKLGKDNDNDRSSSKKEQLGSSRKSDKSGSSRKTGPGSPDPPDAPGVKLRGEGIEDLAIDFKKGNVLDKDQLPKTNKPTLIKTGDGQYVLYQPAFKKQKKKLVAAPERKTGKSSGPKLLDPNPKVISYRLPSGVRQVIPVKLKHTGASSKPIAFKVMQNTQDIYVVQPSHGIVDKDQSVTVEMELQASYTKEDYNIDHKGHEFHLLAIRWPKDITEYSMDQWKRLEKARKEEEQRFVFRIDFDGKKEESVRKKKVDLNSGPLHVLVTPDTVALAPPKTKTFEMELRNLDPGQIGWKIQTNKPNFYVVKPNKGILKRGDRPTVVVEVAEKLTVKDIEEDKEQHQFLLLAIPWRTPKSEFTNEDFDLLRLQNKKDFQRMVIEVELKIEGSKTWIEIVPSILSFKKPRGKAEGQIVPVKLLNRGEKSVAFKMNISHSVMNKFFTGVPSNGVIMPNCGFQLTAGLHPKINFEDLPPNVEEFHFEIKIIDWPTKDYNEDLWDEFVEVKKTEVQKQKIPIDFAGRDRCEGQLSISSTHELGKARPSDEELESNWVVRKKPSNLEQFIEQMVKMQLKQMDKMQKS